MRWRRGGRLKRGLPTDGARCSSRCRSARLAGGDVRMPIARTIVQADGRFYSMARATGCPASSGRRWTCVAPARSLQAGCRAGARGRRPAKGGKNTWAPAHIRSAIDTLSNTAPGPQQSATRTADRQAPVPVADYKWKTPARWSGPMGAGLLHRPGRCSAIDGRTLGPLRITRLSASLQLSADRGRLHHAASRSTGDQLRGVDHERPPMAGTCWGRTARLRGCQFELQNPHGAVAAG